MKHYDEFAEIYDDVSMGLKGDVEFYLRQAKKAKGAVLEIACGTGRILLPLLKEGIEPEGIDISTKMLDALYKKARMMKLRPTVWKADMRNFKVKKKYDLIIIPHRAFNHVEVSNEQIKNSEIN